MATTRRRAVAPKAGPERIKRGLVVEIPRYAGSGQLIQLWIRFAEDRLVVADEEAGTDAEFVRAQVVAALDATLRKRNSVYVLIDPESFAAWAGYEPGEHPEVPTFHRDDDMIVYTHGCGEERVIPRATARALLAALSE